MSRSEVVQKPDILRYLGLASLFCCGLAMGLSVQPIYNTLELQDARRDLDQSQSTLNERNKEIESKNAIAVQFCKEFKGVKHEH